MIHEDEFFKQADILFVLQQRTHQRWHCHLVVGALQGRQRNVFSHQQLEPVDQLAGGGLLFQAGQVAHVVKRLHRHAQQLALERGEVHVHDLAHGVGFGELDEVKEAAAQKGVGQFLFVVRGDEHQRPVLGLDEFARFVAVELHAVDLAQEVVREFDVGLVDFVDQQCHGAVGREGLPQHALDDVVADVLDALGAVAIVELAVAQAAHGVVFIQALLRLGGGLDVPLQQGHVQRLCHFFGQHGLAGAGLALDEQRALQRDGRVHGKHQVLGGDVSLGTLKFHEQNTESLMDGLDKRWL